MKPVRTTETNVTLTMPGTKPPEGDLPAARVALFDHTAGETEQDAKLGFITTWQPDENEARRLEAGACIEVAITGHGHPPISVGVTDALVPERELIDRGHVDRALGLLYAQLRERITEAIDTHGASTLGMNDTTDAGLPDPSDFADLWTKAVHETRPAPPTAQDLKLAALLDGDLTASDFDQPALRSDDEPLACHPPAADALGQKEPRS